MKKSIKSKIKIKKNHSFRNLKLTKINKQNAVILSHAVALAQPGVVGVVLGKINF